MSKRQRRARLYACGVGLAVTLLIGAAYANDWLGLDRFELITYDFRARYTNSIPQDPRIVLIDIDDGSIDRVGRWPWARDEQAPLISIPAELGAKQILVDVTWSEAEPYRTAAPHDSDILDDPLTLDESNADVIFPDYELRTAIAEAGNVHLAYHYRVRDLEGTDFFDRAVDDVQRGDAQDAQNELAVLAAQRERWRTPVTPQASVDDHLRLNFARLTAILQAEPLLTDEQAAARMSDADADFIDAYVVRARLAALRRSVRDWLNEDLQRWNASPAENIRALYAKYTDRPFEDDTPLKQALTLAYRGVLGYAATTADPIFPRDAVQAAAAPVESVEPVYYLHARAAKRCGFVVFEWDVDGVMRRMRPIVQHNGHALTQLAFGVACDELGIGPENIEARDHEIVLHPTKGGPDSIDIQLDDRGRTLVPMVAPGAGGGDRADRPYLRVFEHVPASWLVTIHRMRRDIAENDRVVRDAIERLLAGNLFEGAEQYAAMLAQLKQARTALRNARYLGQTADAEAVKSKLDPLQAAVDAHEKAAFDMVAKDRERLAAKEASDYTQDDFLADARAQLVASTMDGIKPFQESNERLRKDLDRELESLRKVVEGKICLVGYTATSLADMAPMPTDERSPGVMAHANLLNGLLTGRMLHWTTKPTNFAIIIGCGLLTIWLTVFRSPREAVFYLVVAIIVYVLVAGWWMFSVRDTWVVLAAPVVAMVFTFVAISIWVYIFVERERRQLSTALSQYTSKEIARQLAENPELCRRAEMREVTAMFTDLKGFTTISERIGAERTQTVLNTCLGLFTDVMIRHEALVNKFMGDGVFAFWNPVIYPQADHALRACDTAVDLIDELHEFQRKQKADGGDAVFQELVLRVGVATGNAVVGPCGSEQKYDYTCIGDSVNLAARLESANKFYGTHLLVGGAAREQVGERFEFRPLGGVRVKGKNEAVPVYELLGRAGSVQAETLAYAEAFGKAVAKFQNREWQTACEAFAACCKMRPDDLAAEGYLEASNAYLNQPPDDDWNGAIELKEK